MSNGIKKLLSFLVAFMLVFTVIFTAKNTKGGIIFGETEADSVKTEREFNEFINDLSAFPVNFVYDDVYYGGFRPKYFKEVQRNVTESQDKNTVTVEILLTRAELMVRISANLYRSYNAYDYTVYFENISETDSKILSNVVSYDYYIKGENPRLKGILGDHTNQYAPYDYDLTQKAVNFTSTLGRATHVYFPYFNVETDDGGYMLALGWGGTWKSDFKAENGKTHVQFSSCIGYYDEGTSTYLKPGETYRTALIGVLRYYERDEDKATNAWRKWMVDCNLPRENANTDQPVSASMSTCLSVDSDRDCTDGSINEYYGSWQRSLDTMYDHGVNIEFRWFDAGWYYDPYGNTVPYDWWGTVGTWELDTQKWPNNSFKESVDYVRAKGGKTLVWFEPERVTRLDGLTANYIYKREWVLSDWGTNNTFINNLGNKDCFDWTLNRIISFMTQNGIDLYREDFNLDPAIFWSVGDGVQGDRRHGITENLYMQGHYALWDGIIDWCAQNGKCTYVDSCASGGGRNDLESVRRSVPLLRSDSDRTTISLKLAYTTTLCKWLPYTGAVAGDKSDQLSAADLDSYTMRAAYLPHVTLNARWYFEQDTIKWDSIVSSRNEWKEANKYFLKDFYVLTPYRGVNNESDWTSYMYWDNDTDSGLLQAFRQRDCSYDSITVNVKGVNADRYYKVRDIDGNQSVARIKGSELKNGLKITASSARTAVVLYIEPVA